MSETILRRLARVSARLERDKQERNELIVEATEEYTMQVVADAAGLSKARVSQICTGYDERLKGRRAARKGKK